MATESTRSTDPASWSPDDAPTAQIDPDQAVSVLGNGLRVALEPLPHVRSLTVGVWIHTGSMNETAELAGVSHFLEHLVFKGTATRSARDIMDAIESRGGQMNAFTSREYTCYYIKCMSEHLPIALDVLSDMMQRPTFHDFEKERAVILEEIAASMDVPEELIHDLLGEQMWPNHAMGRPVAGSLESVADITMDQVRGYMTTWYEPRHMVVSIAGHLDPAQALSLVDQYFGEMKPVTNDFSVAPPAFIAGVQHHEHAIAQDHLAIGFTSPGICDKRRPVADVLGNILGGGSTSRLFERIREDEGLAYSVYAFHAPGELAGMLGVYAAVNAENLEKTLAITSEELRSLRDTAVADRELQSNKEQLKGSLLLALEGTFNRMARLARSLLHFDEIKTIDHTIAEVDKVSAEDVQQLARDVFRSDNTALTVLGPPSAVPAALQLD